MAKDKRTDLEKIGDYLVKGEKLIAYEGHLYLTNRRLIKFYSAGGFPAKKVFEDMSLSDIVTVFSMSKNYRYYIIPGVITLIFAFIFPLLVPLFPVLPLLDMILNFIPIILGVVGLVIMLYGLKKDKEIKFVSSAGTKMSAPGVSSKFIMDLRTQCYGRRTRTKKRAKRRKFVRLG
jgi:hypothetical protein